jgi:hypothetical protein
MIVLIGDFADNSPSFDQPALHSTVAKKSKTHPNQGVQWAISAES